jgi:hypothetical protein
MKTLFSVIIFSFILFCNTQKINAQTVEIGNLGYSVVFDLSNGTYSGIEKAGNTTIFADAWFNLDPGTRQWKLPEYEYRAEKIIKVNTKFGNGKTLRVWYLPKKSYDPDRFLDITVIDKKPFVVIGWGIRNTFDYEIRVQNAQVLYNAKLFKGQTPANPQVLRGGAGKEANFVENTSQISALNSAMLTYTDNKSGSRKTVVAGGLKYREFARKFESFLEKKKDGSELPLFTLSVFDPQGKRIPAKITWKSEDTYYLNFATQNPFDALEMYGDALATANDANPNRYNFPTLCGWMVSTKNLGEGKPINNSPGLVEQMQIARDRRLNNYTSLAVRLEPDYYGHRGIGDSQQGWWDDEHWAKYGSLKEPYETFRKFSTAVNSLGGNVFTYFQCSMPSNDFAAAHPDWMLNDDISLLHIDHQHHKPLIRYDYTNPDFQKYLLTMWRRLASDGVVGIKFDYPETAWARNGGFDDKTYTTTSAYRKLFQLCREGMGKSAFIHERILGENETPRLDCNAGFVDLQRVWGDASHYEPEMTSRIGLRWYKQAKVFRYYPDGKSFYYKGKPLSSKDRRTFLTLVGLLSGRIELGTSIGSMTNEMFYDLTRMFPTLPNGKTFRPVDFLMNKKHPEVYVYNVSDIRKQVILVNSKTEESKKISTPVSGNQVETGSLGLDNSKEYLVFDFWNQQTWPTISGNKNFEKELQPGEALVFSVTEKLNVPQIVGTNRNVMCGLFEISDTKWNEDSKTLSFFADLIAGEEMTVFIHIPKKSKVKKVKVQSSGSKLTYRTEDEYLLVKLLNAKENTQEKIEITFK